MSARPDTARSLSWIFLVAAPLGLSGCGDPDAGTIRLGAAKQAVSGAAAPDVPKSGAKRKVAGPAPGKPISPDARASKAR